MTSFVVVIFKFFGIWYGPVIFAEFVVQYDGHFLVGNEHEPNISKSTYYIDIDLKSN